MITQSDIQLVILDRDGVINHDSPDYIKHVGEWYPIDGSINAIARLSGAGISVCIATNQAGIGRGLYTREDLEGIHRHLTDLVQKAGGVITHIAFCPHHPDDNCNCRKPSPGMLTTIARVTKIDIAHQPFVGDSVKDVEAAIAAGCTPVIVRTGNGRETARRFPDVLVFDDLDAFSQWVTADV